MSTEIRKVLGYALTDVVSDDIRINWDSPLLSTRKSRPSFIDFANWLETEESPFEPLDVEAIRSDGEAHPYRSVGSCVVHSFHYGLPNVMVLVPPSREDTWIQKDNLFDYIEAHLGDGPSVEPTLNDVPGIPPFDGRWMDKVTGLELNHTFVSGFRRSLELNGNPEQHLLAARKIAVLGRPRPEEALFQDAAAALDRVVRLVPAEARELAAIGDLFTDPDIWKTLRPVLYTYWT